MDIALCKCGIDMSDHEDEELGHEFDAAGTRYRCGEPINGYLCPRPAYHRDYGVPHGPLTGAKLWNDDIEPILEEADADND